MSPDRAVWLLAHPLADVRAETVLDYRLTIPQPDGALLTAVLAVDR